MVKNLKVNGLVFTFMISLLGCNPPETVQPPPNILLIAVDNLNDFVGEKGTFAKVALWNRATHSPLIFSGKGIPKDVKNGWPVKLFSIYPTLVKLCGLPIIHEMEAESIAPLIKDPDMKWEKPAITTSSRIQV